MKSLVESLFDDNVNKKFTFGNIYKLVDVDVYHPNTSAKIGHGWTVDKLYNINMLSRDSGVKGSDVEDTIVKALEKLICNIPVTGNMHHSEFTNILKTFTKYYKSLVNNTRRLKAASWPGIFVHSEKNKYPDGTPYDGNFDRYNNIINNWKLLDSDVKKVKVHFSNIELTFERK